MYSEKEENMRKLLQKRVTNAHNIWYNGRKGGEPVKVYTTVDVAEMLKMDVDTIRKYMQEGKIKAMKLGRVWRVTEEELKKFMESQ